MSLFEELYPAEGKFREFDNQVYQYVVWFWLEKMGNAPYLQEIADYLASQRGGQPISPVTISRALDRLQEHGLIEILENKEGRRYIGRIILTGAKVIPPDEVAI